MCGACWAEPQWGMPLPGQTFLASYGRCILYDACHIPLHFTLPAMWIALSLVCALSLAGSDALTKLASERAGGKVGHYAMAWLRVALCIPLGLGFLTFIEIPPLDSTFWAAFVIAMPFEILALYLYTRALRESPLSLTVPFLAFTPVFILLVADVVLGERVSTTGGLGIVLMVAGGYTLNIDKARGGLMAPIKAIAQEPGSWMMLATAAIFSITATLLKLAINHSSPMFYGAVYYVALGVFFLPLAARELRPIPLNSRVLPIMLFAGALQFLMLMTNMAALSMSKVAYMVSIKRTSLLFGVLLGWLMFREINIRQRLLGAALMLSGFAVVALNS